jgi:hypothetical protein
MVFKNEGKLKTTSRQRMSGKNTEVGDIFQGVTLENTQGWNKQKTSASVKRYQALLANRHMYSSNPQYNDTV